MRGVFQMRFSDKYVKSNFKGICYDSEKGCLVKEKTGEPLSCFIDHRGYRRVNVPTVGQAIEHRAIWAVVHGKCPDMHIDHIDGDKLNNRIENLRICTHNQNQHNQGIRSSNKSGYKGVSWMKSAKKWQAQICCNSKVTHLGLYTNKIEAAKAYDEAAKKLHGDFAWLNFPEKSAPDARKQPRLRKTSSEFGVTER